MTTRQMQIKGKDGGLWEIQRLKRGYRIKLRRYGQAVPSQTVYEIKTGFGATKLPKGKEYEYRGIRLQDIGDGRLNLITKREILNFDYL